MKTRRYSGFWFCFELFSCSVSLVRYFSFNVRRGTANDLHCRCVDDIITSPRCSLRKKMHAHVNPGPKARSWSSNCIMNTTMNMHWWNRSPNDTKHKFWPSNHGKNKLKLDTTIIWQTGMVPQLSGLSSGFEIESVHRKCEREFEQRCGGDLSFNKLQPIRFILMFC